jgi:hypothetical protein
MTYKTSPSTMRIAIRQHLKDPDDLVCLLTVIEEWISSWGEREVEMLPAPPPPQQKKKQDKMTGELPPPIQVTL